MVNISKGLRPAIFLDRDGVLIEAPVKDGVPRSVNSIQEAVFIRQVKEDLLELSKLGFLFIMITNQPDISRNKIPLASALALNQYICTTLGLDASYMCPHDDRDKCGFRKPLPGLINQAAKELKVDLSSSYVVGDRWRDIGAGQATGCNCIFIDYGYDEESPFPPFDRVNSFSEAKLLIMESCK